MSYMLKLSIALYVIRAVKVEQHGDILFESTELRAKRDSYTIRSFINESSCQHQKITASCLLLEMHSHALLLIEH